MRDLNKVILSGRLGKDPVRRATKSGLAVANFSLATSRQVRSDNLGVAKEETLWTDVVAWGKSAESCEAYLKKGAPVLVEGSIRVRPYQDKNGTPRVAHEIHADQVIFLPSGKPRTTGISDDTQPDSVAPAIPQGAEPVESLSQAS